MPPPQPRPDNELEQAMKEMMVIRQNLRHLEPLVGFGDGVIVIDD